MEREPTPPDPPPPAEPPAASVAETAAERFRNLDGYRVAREWSRYEGTGQRDLFRELRRRFLARHRDHPGSVLDLGSGPGRFSDDLGPSRSARVLVDLSHEALLEAGRRARKVRRSRDPWHFVRGDAGRPPLRPAAFGTVALLGNVVGFAADGADRTLGAATALVAPDGVLLIEAVAGPGEHARYFRRLPPGAVRRALRAPAAWIDARVATEGFGAEAARRSETTARFARLAPADLEERLGALGFVVREMRAVAPALGADPERIAAARQDPSSWAGLLELEERLGRKAEHLENAAAYLVAAVRGTPDPNRRTAPAARTVAAPAKPSGRSAPRGRTRFGMIKYRRSP